MLIRETSIAGLVEIFPRVFEDDRGAFFESYNREVFEKAGLPTHFVQDNQSFSIKGVLRGLHFQNEPFAQANWCGLSWPGHRRGGGHPPRVPTFGQYSFSSWTPNGTIWRTSRRFRPRICHPGRFCFSYKCTNLYNKSCESGIIWNDNTLNIDWGIKNPIVSEKDVELPTFKSLFARQIS